MSDIEAEFRTFAPEALEWASLCLAASAELHDLADVAAEFGVDLDDDWGDDDFPLTPVKAVPAPPDRTDW